MHADSRPPRNGPPLPDGARPLGAGPVRPAASPGPRLFRPEMLMIGAMGRNTGKTELACRIIGRHAAAARLAALKVTAVERADGSCPRGGTGCGVCSSLAEPWCVTRELDPDSPKDTSRLLASGAREVYWLRVRYEALADGAAGLLKLVPPRWACVCESNSLRRVVEPGLFLQVRSAGSARFKKSAAAVAHLADGVVASDGQSFDLDLDRLTVLDGQWALRRDACALVLDARAADSGGRRHRELPRPLLTSLRAQFARVLTGAAASGRQTPASPAAGRTRPIDEWTFVCLPTAGAVPAGTVNAMFRRREGADAVLVPQPADERRLAFGLCHAAVLPAVLAAHREGAPIVERLSGLPRIRLLPLESIRRCDEGTCG